MKCHTIEEIEDALIKAGFSRVKADHHESKPWIVTRLILIRDFLMISIGKLGGVKLLEKAFATENLSEEDIQYEAKVLEMISYKTIWRTFDSTDNYSMPKIVTTDCPKIEYWYGDGEEKQRKIY